MEFRFFLPSSTELCFCFCVDASFCILEFSQVDLVDIVKISLFLRLIRHDFTQRKKQCSVPVKETWFFRLVKRFPVRRTCLKGRCAKGEEGFRDEGAESQSLWSISIPLCSIGRASRTMLIVIVVKRKLELFVEISWISFWNNGVCLDSGEKRLHSHRFAILSRKC